MNTNIPNTVYVVYNPKPIVDFMDTGMFVTPSGFRLAPYPLSSDEIKFVGTYLECNIILNALLHYNPN
jgi:hypothetical protein